MRTSRTRVTTILTIALLALLTIGTGIALAHVSITARSPANNATVSTSPSKVTITFNGTLKSGTLKVYNSNNKKVSSGNGGVDPRNVKRLSTSISGTLGNGKYTVKWTEKSADGHSQSGSYKFTVKK